MSVNDCFILEAALTHDGVIQLGLEAKPVRGGTPVPHSGTRAAASGTKQQGCSRVPPNQPPSQHCIDGNNQQDNLENT